ncbi:Na(+)/H(+) antiporter NhaA [bacterium HR21]|nr:Na(+)/H(+) antiporter NhaA [bacterium HR21]
MRIPLVELYYTYQKTPLERLRDRLQEFFERPYMPGVLLLLCTLVALVWANSPWGESYVELFFTHVVIGYGDFALSKPLVLWINDGLMAIFFFLVGLEIKQEVLDGELSTWKKAALPVMAAVGGMLVPALIFTAFNLGRPSQRGWAIPAATDIAFAVGILSLLGNRVLHPLRIFLLSLAIADDIGAVLVIALFYTDELSLPALLVGLLGLAVLWGCNRLRISNLGVYGILGIPIWIAFLKSGVHPTIAGVLIALTVPIRERIPWQYFAEGTKRLLADAAGRDLSSGPALLAIAEQIEKASVLAVPPLQRAMHGLHAWVNYGIMPLFALANAGVRLELEQLGTIVRSPVLWGVALGLFAGKQLGVFGVSWVMTKLKVATLPSGIRWSHIYGVSLLAGIGFTMALFIAGLAYGDSLLLLNEAKLGILLGSALSALFGLLVLWRVLPAAQR